MKVMITLVAAVLGLGLLAACVPSTQVHAASTAEGWLTDFEAAKAAAKALDKVILVNFSGSDWCGWCIRLDEEVLTQAEFKAFAEQRLVLLSVDFPRRAAQGDALKEHHQKLAETFGVQGFPTILLVDPDGKVLARTGYQPGGAAAYVAHLEKLLGSR